VSGGELIAIQLFGRWGGFNGLGQGRDARHLLRCCE
jgi:hypothetical protein